MSKKNSPLAEPVKIISPSENPTRVRFLVAGMLTAMSCLLYLDRFAVGIASEYIREDLGMTQRQMSWFLSAFFWSYALSQVPAGWLSDRFGPRRMLTTYILGWSLFTGFLGLATHVWQILQLRLLCGIAQAGAYPVCAGVIRTWFPVTRRGTISSVVAMGGRVGAVLAPVLTAILMVALSAGSQIKDFREEEIFNAENLLIRLQESSASTKPEEQFLRHLQDNFPAELKLLIRESAATALEAEREKQELQQNKTRWQFDLNNWFPPIEDGEKAKLLKKGSLLPKGLIAALSDFVRDSAFGNPDSLRGLTLERRGQDLLEKMKQDQSLEVGERRLLNRLALEAALPLAIRKFAGQSWRTVLIAYGLAGIGIALALVWILRDSPDRHPLCNAAEKNLIQQGVTETSNAGPEQQVPFPWTSVLSNVSLWGSSLTQFTTNIGWLFVVTWLPRYLGQVHGVSLREQALMTAVPTVSGILGMFCGGWWTDFAVQRVGLKWGRRLPITLTRFLAAGGYLFCLALAMNYKPDPALDWLPWGIILGLSAATFFCDLGIPAMWGYAQDVGGKYTASIMGWANMYGNFGAACAPLIYNAVLGENPTLIEWNQLFGVCAGMFVLSGCAAMVIDATRPIGQSVTLQQ